MIFSYNSLSVIDHLQYLMTMQVSFVHLISSEYLQERIDLVSSRQDWLRHPMMGLLRYIFRRILVNRERGIMNVISVIVNNQGALKQDQRHLTLKIEDLTTSSKGFSSIEFHPDGKKDSME